MRILFIGGTGNISSECTRLLHEAGHTIGVFTRGGKDVSAAYTAIKGDRHDFDSLCQAREAFRPDVVLNFIGYEPGDLELDLRAFNGAVRQYVFISSTTVYSRPAKLPVREDSAMGNDFWDYARKKAECERWLGEQRNAKFPYTIVRPSHTYSKWWIPNNVASSNQTFADRMLRRKPVFVHDDGECPWTLTAASDFAVGLAGLLGQDNAVGNTFHITSDEALTWNQIFRLIADALGVKDPVIEKIPSNFICNVAPSLTGTLKGDKAHPGIFDNSKVKRFVPGFACRKPFAQGIKESVEWLRADPSRWKVDPSTEDIFEKVLGAWADSR